jgi:nitroimidazol reductase NimA-like FMN-containing flavoprotein (pyridoxamine 5'-phosphate oxidase superfamily)
MDTAPSDRSRLRRKHQRGHYDEATVHAILDAQPVAHVAYVFDGAPVVTPTLQWREGSHIYWHGSAASRMLEQSEGAEVCVAVTLIDGFVMARSAFNHSCNYRSVMVFGKAYKVIDPAEKLARLKAFTDTLFPGRWDMLRPATPQEIKATTVLGLSLEESAAKIRNGAPGDDEEDYALPIWAGVIPIKAQVLPPIDDPRLLPGLTPPHHVRNFRIG